MTISSQLQTREVTVQSTQTSYGRAALVAGFGLLVMAVLGIWGQMFVLPTLIVPGEPAATVSNIVANEGMFRASILSWVAVLICDVLVAWGLYVFLKPVSRSLSLLTAWFRLTYTVVHGAALLCFALVLLLINSAEYATLLGTDQLHALVSLFVEGRSYGFMIALLFFGVHLVLLGYLVFKSGYVPKVLGVLVMAAGVGYLVDSAAHILLANYADYQAIFQIFAFFMAIGELALMVWLLWKGSKAQTPEAVN